MSEVLKFFDDFDPCIYYFIKSGSPNKTIIVSEDPYFGASLKVVDGTPEELLAQFEIDYKENYKDELDTTTPT